MRGERRQLLLLLAALAAHSTRTSDADDPCSRHQVLDDVRRSPLYQPETPRDVLCDRRLEPGWYRFTMANRSAEMPTRCASVNYCGTQAPIWIRLDDGQRLPLTHGDQIETTGCVSWTAPDADGERRVHGDDESPGPHETDCCAMRYPVTVRSCHSSYLVYKLVPTEACNMAYCSQPASSHDEHFDFGAAVPSVRSVFVDHERSTNQLYHHDHHHRHHYRQHQHQHRDNVYLNCSIQVQLANVSPKIRFRFQWTKRGAAAGSAAVAIRTALVHRAVHYDLLARNEITAGDKVTCQVEAVTTDDLILPGGRASSRVMASSTSAPFTAGIAIQPGGDRAISAYKNGSRYDVTLSATVPFVCARHLSPKDCHLSVEIVQHLVGGGGDVGERRPLAIAPCSLSLGSAALESRSFVALPVSDFVRLDRETAAQLELVVTSYGDAWWHGFRLPNITIQIKDVPPVQCYAFTQGHVIGVSDSLDRVTHAARHLLYSNPLQSFEVWVEYEACSGGSTRHAVCICSVEVRSFGALPSGETFRLERCHRSRHQQRHPKRTTPEAGASKWSLARMSLVGFEPKRRHFRVLESRQGKMITVVLESGARIRTRTENWGMSVSVLDSGQEREDLVETIGGLCNPDNELGRSKSPGDKGNGRVADESHLASEFCTCAPSQHAFLSSVQMHNLPKCDPELEECPSACQEPQETVEWTTFFNYVDITDQVRGDVAGVDGPHLNLIDQPQRDSASVEDDPHHQFFPAFASQPVEDLATGTNLGRDIYWTTGHGRRRRDASFKTFQASSDREDISLYCSNLLVNSTVALECGQYLLGSFIMKAIAICIDDVSRNEDLTWAQEALGLLEDQCEVEASYRRTSDWSRDLLGHQAVSPAIIEALNCPNRCSFKGVCLSFGCVCQPGFSGSDCSLMDDDPPRIERIGNSGGLCDVLTNDCSRIEIVGSGFIDSSRLSCQVQPGKFDGALWHRGGIGNSDRTVPTSAEFVSHEKIVCHLLAAKPARRHLLDDVSQELHLEVKASNDGGRYSAPQRLTLYHSGCRACPKSKGGWPLCSDRDDVCYLDNTCFAHGQINPKNSCEKCDSDRPLSWSFNSANGRPVVIGSLKTSVYDGQLLEYVMAVIDDDPDIKFELMDPLSDAKITKDGVFRWTAVSNALTSNHDVFWVQVYDDCHPPVDVKLQVEVLPCPCLNAGVCKNEAINDTLLLASNRIHEKRPHYRCECPPGFGGGDCSSRVDHCDPNPCKNGLCSNEDHGFSCSCFSGHTGVTCDRLLDRGTLTNASLDGCRCLNGGSCSTPGNKCRCPDGFAGGQCQRPAAVCDPACQNGGRCSRRSPGSCNCKKGWTGRHCETAVCEPGCVNGGRCSSPGKCTCPTGYRGLHCQKPVCKPKCRNGGQCASPGVCRCPAGLTGSLCQYPAKVASSTTSSPRKSAKRRSGKRRTKSKHYLSN